MQLVGEIRQILDNYEDLHTQIIASSIRHPLHVVQAAMLGAEVATIPFAVLEKLFNHPLTDIGVQRFLDDWQKAGLNID